MDAAVIAGAVIEYFGKMIGGIEQVGFPLCFGELSDVVCDDVFIDPINRIAF